VDKSKQTLLGVLSICKKNKSFEIEKKNFFGPDLRPAITELTRKPAIEFLIQIKSNNL